MFSALLANGWPCLLAMSAVALLTVSAIVQLHESGVCLFRVISRFLRRPWFEVAILLFLAGGMVQYGSTKGFLGAPSMLRLPTVTEGAEASAVQFPAYTNAVTNLCFTGILPGATSLFLRAAWTANMSIPNNALEIYARHDLATNGWESIGTACVGDTNESVIVELPHAYLPGGWTNSTFFALGLCADTDPGFSFFNLAMRNMV